MNQMHSIQQQRSIFCKFKILLGGVAPHLQVNLLLLNQTFHLFSFKLREKPLGGKQSNITITAILCLMDILKRFGSFFFLMAESLPDESEKTIDSEDENVKICFPAVSLNGLGLCNDGVVESARTTKKVDRKPVNVVLGRVRSKQVRDKLSECWSFVIH